MPRRPGEGALLVGAGLVGLVAAEGALVGHVPEDGLELRVRDQEVQRAHGDPLEHEADRVEAVRRQPERVRLGVVVGVVGPRGARGDEQGGGERECGQEPCHGKPPWGPGPSRPPRARLPDGAVPAQEKSARAGAARRRRVDSARSEEHTSNSSHTVISYAVFCLKKKMTFVYVTHDQEEALSLSDWIDVMNAGKAEKAGAPWESYYHPKTAFPAHSVDAVKHV